MELVDFTVATAAARCAGGGSMNASAASFDIFSDFCASPRQPSMSIASSTPVERSSPFGASSYRVLKGRDFKSVFLWKVDLRNQGKAPYPAW